MKSLLYWLVMLTAAIPAVAQTGSTPGHSPDPHLNVKFQDIKWQKIAPDLGDRSPEIVILRVDPHTQATQLMIRVPKNFHVPRHWHSANETHTVVSGAFIVQHGDGEREELGAGSFNYIPRKMVHQGWTTGEGALLFITVDGAWDVNWVDGAPTGAEAAAR